MREILVSKGNNKLKRGFVIFNICSATDCPSFKLGLCELEDPLRDCYALKSERLYKQVLPYRRRQEKVWDALTADEFATQLVAKIERMRRPVKYVRCGEAGDFRNQDDVTKLSKIAELLLKETGIVTYCFTARSDLSFKNVAFTANGSGFMLHNEFHVGTLPPEAKARGAIQCKGKDCDKCRLDKDRLGLEVWMPKI